MTNVRSESLTHRRTVPLDDVPPRTVAVIDIGSSSIRLAVAELHADGEIRTLEKLSQGVHLGKDTFTGGEIKKKTIEQCVQILKSFRLLLNEYQIHSAADIRVVATSAVREASNRLAFIDRIYSATQMQVEILDEAVVTRTTYLSVLSYLRSQPESQGSLTVVIEVGGGSTELLAVEGEDVTYSHSYRLGSIRLRETLEKYRAPTTHVRSLMELQIDRALEQGFQHLKQKEIGQLLVVGGDIRLAMYQLHSDWNPEQLGLLTVSELAEYTNHVLNLRIDELVQKYHLTYPEAEAFGPALLTYLRFAEGLQLSNLMVSKVNLRDGMLHDMANHGGWTEVLSRQIIHSALDLARKFQVEEQHALHVAKLTKSIFQQMMSEHGLPSHYELMLYLAALLHEVGLFISSNSFHKHTLHLIRHSEVFGLGQKDVLLVALIARYHRRASPKPTHEGYASLNREQRVAVSKCAALLRIADALDQSHSQRINNITCAREKNHWVISIPHVDDFSLERIALEQKGGLFEEIYGTQVLLRSDR